MSEKFGFTVRRAKDYHTKEPAGWNVTLPHQCDSWQIAGDWGNGDEHGKAIAELERFLAEGAEALAALKAGREFGDDE